MMKVKPETFAKIIELMKNSKKAYSLTAIKDDLMVDFDSVKKVLGSLKNILVVQTSGGNYFVLEENKEKIFRKPKGSDFE